MRIKFIILFIFLALPSCSVSGHIDFNVMQKPTYKQSEKILDKNGTKEHTVTKNGEGTKQ